MEGSTSVPVRIARALRDQIEAGEYPLGDRLPSEAELARQFGVSRPSVREALGALQFVGYVGSVRGSGSRVVSDRPRLPRSGREGSMDATAALDVFEARLLVEPQAARLAAIAPVPDKVEEASSLIEGMRLVVRQDDLSADTDLMIHRALAEICPNAHLRQQALHLVELAASPDLAGVRAQAWDNHVLPPIWGHQHREVLSAIEQRDTDAAELAAWNHLASSCLNALTVLSQDPSVDHAAVDRLAALADGSPDAARTGPLRHAAGKAVGRAAVEETADD